ncbi:ABC transporter permease [Microvirga sp. TS319]|uniref:ABC transporter permease n=1 Tax=Microvirga sp. TS319 TaxID=3241165 RepID=UPI003519F9B3
MVIKLVVRIVSFMALAYLVLPLVVIIGSSLTTTSFLAFPPQGLTLSWFGKVIADASYLSAFAMSTVLAACATAVAVLFAVPSALAIARYSFPGKRLLSAVLMSPLILPHVVLGAALLQYGTAIGLTRSFLALLVGHIVIITPFVLRAVLPQFTHEQQSLEEASADLGGGPVVTFFLITFPQIRSGVLSGAIFAFIASWINVELSIFNTTAELTTIPVKLFNYVQYTIDPTIAAVSAITILVAALVIIILDLTLGLDVLSERR